MLHQGTGWQKRVKLAGFGGQGLLLAGTILGKAVILGGKEVLQGQSYGPASRGGTCESNLVVSEEDINELSFADQEFDVVVCLSQLAFDRYCRSLKRDGLLIVDERFVRDVEMAKEGTELRRVPFTDMAEGLGNRGVANVVMLGYVVGQTGLVSREYLREAVLDTIPTGTEDLNLRALEEGFRLDPR